MPDTVPRSTAVPTAGLWLVGAARQSFAGSAAFLDDPANRAEVAAYLADLPGSAMASGLGALDGGHSYGEMAEALIRTLAPADPVDLLVLAYAVHDVQPGRATATYLSSVCPGTPLSFAVSDQGPAAAFTGLRIARAYLAGPAGAGAGAGGAGVAGARPAGGDSVATAADSGRRALLVVAEQAGQPYPSTGVRPAEHRALALLLSARAGGVPAGATGRLTGLRQRPDTAVDEVAGQATADLAELSAGRRRVRVVASPVLAELWSGPDGLRTGPAGQPSTGVWWQLLDELAAEPPVSPVPADLIVAADYDPALGYLCLAAFEPAFEPA